MHRPHDVENDLAAEFSALRPRLLGVAYSIIGGAHEAEDVVQEAWLRLSRVSPATIDDITGWLLTTVSRLALDVLRSARVRREEYVGPWLPEPVVTTGGTADAVDPADRVTLDESLSLAMLVVLESLSPAERAVFVLHDVFGMPFDEVAAVVGRTPAACRKLASRARRHVAARAPRFDVDADAHRRIVAAFARATTDGDIDALLALLDPEAVLRSDGGGAVKAALRPILGADRIARFLAGIRARMVERSEAPATEATRFTLADVNGRAGLLWLVDGRLHGVCDLTMSAGRVTEIDLVLNPEKLRKVT